jgi:hypothetical protein
MHRFDPLSQKQPGICEFVTELTSDSATEIQELSLFLSYMVFKAVEAAEPEGIDKLKEVLRTHRIGLPRKRVVDRPARRGLAGRGARREART